MIKLKNVLYPIIFVLIIFCRLSQQYRTIFRPDYTYLRDIQSFYKIHTYPKTWEEAKSQCSLEGASLFFPDNRFEAEIVIEFWKKHQPFIYAFIGVSAPIVRGVFETIDGLSINEVYSEWSPGEPNNLGGNKHCVVISRLDGQLSDEPCDKKLPYICKKAQKDVAWNVPCDIPDLGYMYNKDLNRCYKLHGPANWTAAYATCRAEQSYLAVINSVEEAAYLSKLVEESKKPDFFFNYVPGFVFLGFHNLDNTGWKTIQGTPLEESGYARWALFRPNGALLSEKCGSMFYNSLLDDNECSLKMLFICEHELGPEMIQIDSRLFGYF